MASRAINRQFALLAIHPKYVDAILAGEKRVEFRKTSFKRHVTDIVVYATAPKQLVVCHFEIRKIKIDKIDNLWETYQEVGGIEFEEYTRYYSCTKQGVAIEIGNVSILKNPMSLDQIDDRITPPQSFTYLSYAQFRKINRRKVVGYA